MMKKAISITALLSLAAVFGLAAGPQTGGGVEFGPDRWDLANAKVVDYLGRKAVMGTALLKDVEFRNGTIEVDIAASTDRGRSYPGLLFRVQPNRDWERVYIRPHRHTLYSDVLQYVAAFNGVDSWQFYNGYGATATATIPVKEWFHVKIEVAGSQARVFIGDSARPALVIPGLKHGLSRGSIGVMGPLDGTAYFSNFTYREDDALDFGAIPPVDVPPGAILDWQISRPFPLAQIDLEQAPEAQNLGDMAWKPLTAEPGGLVDISRLYPRTAQPDLVFAKATIQSEADDVRRYDIGYSDIATVFLNGRPVFTGDSRYQYRDSSFLGIAGYYDSVYLPLRKGANELVVAVAEVSGGWGFMIRDGRAVFALDGMEQAWETPRSLRVPESAAYDAARDCLYVSNYDAYNPEPGRGPAVHRQAVPGRPDRGIGMGRGAEEPDRAMRRRRQALCGRAPGRGRDRHPASQSHGPLCPAGGDDAQRHRGGAGRSPVRQRFQSFHDLQDRGRPGRGMAPQPRDCAAQRDRRRGGQALRRRERRGPPEVGGPGKQSDQDRGRIRARHHRRHRRGGRRGAPRLAQRGQALPRGARGHRGQGAGHECDRPPAWPISPLFRPKS